LIGSYGDFISLILDFRRDPDKNGIIKGDFRWYDPPIGVIFVKKRA
jgi:hypothetical protein